MKITSEEQNKEQEEKRKEIAPELQHPSCWYATLFYISLSLSLRSPSHPVSLAFSIPHFPSSRSISLTIPLGDLYLIILELHLSVTISTYLSTFHFIILRSLSLFELSLSISMSVIFFIQSRPISLRCPSPPSSSLILSSPFLSLSI